MVQPVSLGPVETPVRRSTPDGPVVARAPSVSSSPATAPPPHAVAPAPAPAPPRKPLVLSVDKAESGVFVYTLRDPENGTVLAVIPRDTLQNASGRNLDTLA